MHHGVGQGTNGVPSMAGHMRFRCKKLKDEICERWCVVCGFPGSVVSLVRLTWKESKKRGAELEESTPEIVVAKNPKSNDVLVCEDCIRQIKRLPFSDFVK